MRRPSAEDRAAKIRAARRDADSPTTRAALVAGLADRSAHVVVAAASVIAETELRGFADALKDAFEKRLTSGHRLDPGCRAKVAVVRALLATGEHDAAVYLAGARHVQLEPVWGGQEDTAPELRAQSLLGLIRSRHPGAAVELARLLADTEHGTRAGAAEAAAEIDPLAAVPLLRFKVLIGDPEPEVIGAAWSSLLALAPAESLAAASEALAGSSEDEAEAVALALGASRLEGAFEPLLAWSERVSPSKRPTALTALALLRQERAFDRLIAIVARGPLEDACDSLRALAPFRHDAKLVKQVRAAVAGRRDARLRDLLAKTFAAEEAT